MELDLTNYKKVYVSFPISGNDLDERAGFANKTIEVLKPQFPEGTEFVNPIELSVQLNKKHKDEGKELPTYEEYMKNDLDVIKTCDAIVFCKDWDTSKGCMREHIHAAYMKVKHLYMNDKDELQEKYFRWKPVEPPKFPFELFGIECGKGWKSLYMPILEEVANYNKDKESEEEKIQVHQVKEKYGGLRVYLSHYTEKLEKMIDDAEDKSYDTCELCGKPGKVRGHGWLYTRCDDCWKEMEAKRKEYEDLK